MLRAHWFPHEMHGMLKIEAMSIAYRIQGHLPVSPFKNDYYCSLGIRHT